MQLNLLLNSIYSVWWLTYIAAISMTLYPAMVYFDQFYIYVNKKYKSKGVMNFYIILSKMISENFTLDSLPRLKNAYSSFLKKAGFANDFSAEELFIMQSLIAFSVMILWSVSCFLFSFWSFAALLVLSLLSWCFPILWLKLRSSARMLQARRDLPYFIDFLALVMASGQGFDQGIKLVVSRSPDGLLKKEFESMAQRSFLGVGLSENINRMKENIPSKEVSLFVNALVQSIKSGSGMSKILLGLSKSMQQSRFNNAEEEAGKISVRMILPITLFILPATVLILMGPMVIEWINFQ